MNARKETDTTKLRELLEAAGLSQRSGAAHFGIDERTMRRYCGGDLPVPTYLFVALEQHQPDAKLIRELCEVAIAYTQMARPFVTGMIANQKADDLVARANAMVKLLK